ncbi:hypothetical protein WKH79_05445 [Qipengyuania sp. GPGPB31]|uniref:SMODS domain-containing nucleotidyltransferase n=1 Tax=Qipengyuania sp. GPGPB31 TaxID=3023518 RepID=UPI0031345244
MDSILVSVSRRFDKFLADARLTATQLAEGRRAKESVVATLNRHYYGIRSSDQHSRFIGSWAKSTRIRPPRDVDVQFILPQSVRDRFDLRVGNKQSQILQEVKGVLSKEYYSTSIRGDGPVVQKPFSKILVEVVPAFVRYPSGTYVCVTSYGGYYKAEDYPAQEAHINASNSRTNGNTKDLIRMLKVWQRHCNVPLRSFLIELTSVGFLDNWGSSGKSSTYYDWMIRDYFQYLLRLQNGTAYAPGTGEAISLGDAWASRAETALARARRGCEFESAELIISAGEEWQKIFGANIPKYV